MLVGSETSSLHLTHKTSCMTSEAVGLCAEEEALATDLVLDTVLLLGTRVCPQIIVAQLYLPGNMLKCL